jgi:cyclase
VLQPRLIPTLLIDQDLHLVKTTRFGSRHYIGDPLNAAYVYSGYEVDELLVLDIDASAAGRLIPLAFVEALARFTTVPLAIGGGIRSLEDIQSLLALGVERVVLGAVLCDDFPFLAQAAQRFGSSTISALINMHRSSTGGAFGYFGRGGESFGVSVDELALACERAGAGEVIVYDVDREGTRLGFDVPIFAGLNEALSIPLVALGGCGLEPHIDALLATVPVSGVAAGSLFAYAPGTREVLLNYPVPTSPLRRLRGLKTVGSR